MPALGVVIVSEREDGAHPVGLVAGVGVHLGVRVGREVDGDRRPRAPVPEGAQEGVVVVQAAELGGILVVEIGEVRGKSGCATKSVIAQWAKTTGFDLLRV